MYIKATLLTIGQYLGEHSLTYQFWSPLFFTEEANERRSRVDHLSKGRLGNLYPKIVNKKLCCVKQTGGSRWP